MKRSMSPYDALTDPKADDRVREALRDADRNGKLGVVAAVTGIAGGTAELRRIMDSTGELDIMDRGVLLLHLETPHPCRSNRPR